MKRRAYNTFMHIGSNIDNSKYSFSPQSIPEWNKLSNTIINAPGVETFKNRLKDMPPTRA